MLTAALQGPATRAGGLWIPPAQPRIGPQALHSDSQHPLHPAASLTTAPATASPAPPGWVNFQAAHGRRSRTDTGSWIASVAPTRRRQRQRTPAFLPVPARNTRSQRPCKAPPRAQVVSGYPLLNPESALRLSILTPQHPLHPAASLTTAPATAPPAPPGWVNFQAAHGRRSRAHTGSWIASVAPTRRRQRQRTPAFLPVPARNTRSQRPCKAPPRAQVVSGYPLLNPESALRLSILTPSTR